MSWPRPLHACSAAAFLLKAFVFFPVPNTSPVRPFPSPFLPPSLALPPPAVPLDLASVRPAPPRAPLPPAPGTDISRKEEYVGNQTGRVFARWVVVVRSTLNGKSPSRPLPVVGYGISLPRFLHRPQQYHPAHFRPALRNSPACADGLVVEQVE